MRQLGGLGLVCALMTSMVGRVQAQCPTTNLGAASLGSGIAAAPASDTNWSPLLGGAGSFTYTFQGTKVFVVNNNNMAAAPITTGMVDSPGTINGYPIPVQLNGNSAVSIFMSSTDGIVKRFDFNGSTLVQSCSTVALTQGGSCASDTLTATPTVMLHAFSTNPAFLALNKDVVYVPTHYGCGAYATNQVVAIDAATCAVLWRFNLRGNYPMDYASEGCSLDYGDSLNNPTLYCGTHLPMNHPEGTLWAIDAVAGTIRWGVNADSIITRPELRNGRLYVGTATGALRVHSTTDGSIYWLTGLGPQIAKNVYVEQRVAGGLNSQVLATDTNGVVHALTDNGPGYGTSWTYSASVNSAPTVSNVDGKVFVGTTNGQVHQINLLTGVFEHGVAADPLGSAVFDPAMDVSSKAASGLDRLRVSTSAASGNLKSFCIPWVADGVQSGSDVPVPTPGNGPASPERLGPGAPHPQVACTTQPPANTACVTYTCDTNNGNWKPNVAANGTACNDGLACTCDSPPCPGGADDHCQSGVCVSNNTDSTCNPASCATVGQKGVCPNSTFCCGGGKCVDLMNDRLNCGYCGNICSHTRFGAGTPTTVDKCVKGTCVRDAAFYCSPLAPDEATLNPMASQLTGASNINFPTLVTDASTPCAMAFSFDNSKGAGDCGCSFICSFGPGHNNGVAILDPKDTGTLRKWQPSSCSLGLGTTFVTPFMNVWPLWGSNYNFTNDWILAGATANLTTGNTGPAAGACGGFLQQQCTSAPLPGTWLVTNELATNGVGTISTDNTTAYSIDGASPFFTQDYNQGVVGPVIADNIGSYTNFDMYYGNWYSTGTGNGQENDGSLSIVSATCPTGTSTGKCTFTVAPAPGWPPADGSLGCGFFGCPRITTMTFSDYECKRTNPNLCPACPPRTQRIFLTAGTKVFLYQPPWCSPIGGQVPATSSLWADAANWVPNPDPNLGEEPVIGFVSMTADPLYGDLYFEAHTTMNHLEDLVLYIPNTYTSMAGAPGPFYNVGDMAKSLGQVGQFNSAPIPVPYIYTTTTPEARLAAASAVAVRMTVEKDTNPTFTNLPLWP
jgi:hypothetical protein